MERKEERKEKHIDEGTLHAWLDGALSPEESARVEAHVASCAACGAAAAEARGLVAAASRILTALDDVPGGVAPGGSGGRGAGVRFDALAERRRRRWTGWPLRAAAAVIFVVAGSLAVVQQMRVQRVSIAPLAETPRAETPRVAEPLITPQPPPSALQQAAKKQQPARKRAVVAPPAPAAAPSTDAARSAVMPDSIAREPRTVMITGRVVSSTTGQPVQQATVHLLNNPSVSSATNATGEYTIPVPADQVVGRPAKITVRSLGFESKLDSVTVAQSTPTDTVRRDIALAPATTTLSQVAVTGAGQPTAAAKAAAPSPPSVAGAMASAARRSPRIPTAAGCYTMDVAGLPSRIELGEHLRVMPPDSAAFPTAYWMPVGRTAVRIVFTDTSGTTREIRAMIESEGLRGYVTRSDSASVVTPFSASKTSPLCP